jgi:leader peptidase (prepilin peptidase)/N-methyltransferase
MESGLFPAWTWVIGFAIGAFFGSFLNVVIYRLPRGLSLGNPKYSFCPKCRHRLTAPDLVPLLSWLFRNGKCRHCGERVPARYFVVELVNASLWGVLWYQLLAQGSDVGQFIAYAAAGSTLVAIVFVDWELYLIPDQLNAFLWVVGIAYNVWLISISSPEAWTWGIPSSLAGWIAGVATLWGIALFGRVLFRKDAMGHGDIKMARGIGAVVFPAAALLSFGLAVVLGAVLGIVQIAFRSRLEAKQGVSPSDSIGDEEDEEEWEPESIGSLLKCGFGYLICLDIVGLFAPRLYESWFGEPAYVPLEEDDFEVERTMIPFGPYLAAGAIGVILFRKELLSLVDAYLNWVSGSEGVVEHARG